MATDSISVRIMTEPDIKATARTFKRISHHNHPSRVGLKYIEAKCRYQMNSGHSFALIACRGEDVKGFTIATSSMYPTKLPRKLVLPALLSFLCRPWIIGQNDLFLLILRRGLRGMFHSKTTGSPFERLQSTLSLSLIGAEAQYRGLGIAGRLLSRFESEATRLGVTQITARTNAVNAEGVTSGSVAKAYEKQGWTQSIISDIPKVFHYVWNAPS